MDQDTLCVYSIMLKFTFQETYDCKVTPFQCCCNEGTIKNPLPWIEHGISPKTWTYVDW